MEVGIIYKDSAQLLNIPSPHKNGNQPLWIWKGTLSGIIVAWKLKVDQGGNILFSVELRKNSMKLN